MFVSNELLKHAAEAHRLYIVKAKKQQIINSIFVVVLLIILSFNLNSLKYLPYLCAISAIIPIHRLVSLIEILKTENNTVRLNNSLKKLIYIDATISLILLSTPFLSQFIMGIHTLYVFRY